MWKKFNTEQSSYFINFRIENKRYKIYVTDYLKLWFANFSETSFIDCLKESNPDLELKNDILKDMGIQMLSNPDSLKKVVFTIEGPTMVIFISMSFAYIVNINLKLTEASNEMFFLKVTQPLLKMIQSLQSSGNELQLLLKRKDREIDEYKSEGVKVARHFKTPKFDEKAHKTKYNVFEENFGASEIPNGLLEKLVSVPEERDMANRATIQVKVEPAEQAPNIKIEPKTPTMESPSSSTFKPTSVKRELVKTETGVGERKKRVAKLNL